jgi:hypothetical protein
MKAKQSTQTPLATGLERATPLPTWHCYGDRITVDCASELSGRPRTAESGADTPRFRGSRKLVPKRDELVDCDLPASIFIQLLYQLL